MKRLQELNNRLSDRDEEGLASVERIESIFTVNHIKGSDGWLETGPLLERVSDDAADLEEKRQQAITNPLLLRTVISKDGQATILTLYLGKNKKTSGKDDEAGPEETKTSQDEDLYAGVERILEDFEDDFDSIFQIGSPALQMRMKLPVASYGVSRKEIHDHHSINCCNCFFGLPCFLT